MKEGDEWKGAFCTNHGLFKPLVMFFSLTNSLATFQAMMNDIFWDLVAKGTVVVYIDNILIFTETVEQHRRAALRGHPLSPETPGGEPALLKARQM